MKHVLLLLTLVFGLTSLPATTFAKDKKKDYDDDWRKISKELRIDLDGLQKYYEIMKDRVKNMNGGRRQWDELHDVRANIDDLSYQLDSGRFNPRDFRARIDRGTYDLRHIQDELDYINKGPRGGYYRR